MPDYRYCAWCGEEYDALHPDRHDCAAKGTMTLNEIASRLNYSYDSLAKAAREGRIEARLSKANDNTRGVWLSTIKAVEQAIEAGTLRPRGKAQ